MGAEPSRGLAIKVKEQMRGLGCRISPAKWNTQFRLVMRALPFDRRRAEAKMSTREDPYCYLCGEGDDSARHFYGECEVVREARKELGARIDCKLPEGLGYTALAFERTKGDLGARAILHFNWAVWDLRGKFFATLAAPRTMEAAARKIVAHTLLHFSPQEGGKRLKEEEIKALATQPPTDSLVGFSDGSRLKDGSAGAGYTLRALDGRTVRRADPLGIADNNEAEMAALKGLFNLLLLWDRAKPATEPRCNLRRLSSLTRQGALGTWCWDGRRLSTRSWRGRPGSSSIWQGKNFIFVYTGYAGTQASPGMRRQTSWRKKQRSRTTGGRGTAFAPGPSSITALERPTLFSLSLPTPPLSSPPSLIMSAFPATLGSPRLAGGRTSSPKWTLRLNNLTIFNLLIN